MKCNFLIVFVLVCFSGFTSAETTTLSAPVFTYSKNELTVTLEWNTVDSAEGYTLYYTPYPYTEGNTIHSIEMNSELVFSAQLSAGAAYFVALKAYNDSSVSEYSNIELIQMTDNLNFKVEEGIRLDYAAQVYAISQNSSGQYRIYDPSYEGIYLTHKNTNTNKEDDVTQPNTNNIAFSTDGLNFPDRESFAITDKPGILLSQPDSNGNSILRKFILSSEGLKSKTSTDGGKTYIDDDGLRYQLREEDKESIGYYDTFHNNQGQILLLYIGAFGFAEENIRLAISEDNGETFQFKDANPLNDSGLSQQGFDHRDPRVTLLADGRLRVFSMVQGSTGAPIPGTKATGLIYSHTSTDGGYTWTKDEGIRLSKDDFSYDVWSLNDPHVVRLADGRYRMYVTALIADDSGNSTTGYKEVIISAISQ